MVESVDDLESAKEDLEPLLLETMAKAAGNVAKRVAIAKLRKPLEGWLNQTGASGMTRGVHAIDDLLFETCLDRGCNTCQYSCEPSG